MPFSDFADEVFDAIKAHLVASWTATPIAYPNEYFDPVESGPWVYVAIDRNLYGQQSIGASVQAENRWDEDGILWLHLNVPNGTSASQIGGAAKALANIFRGLTLLNGDLEFMDASISAGGPASEDGNWFSQSISVEWRHMDA